MHENEVSGIEYVSVKPSFITFLKKIAVKLHLISADKPVMGKPLVKTTNMQQEAFTATDQHSTVIGLMNQGKKYDDAARIADVAKQFDLDLGKIDSDKIKVKGKSVWINLED
jgi:hypothetical protein